MYAKVILIECLLLF